MKRVSGTRGDRIRGVLYPAAAVLFIITGVMITYYQRHVPLPYFLVAAVLLYLTGRLYDRFYSHARFEQDRIIVKTPFKKTRIFDCEQIVEIGRIVSREFAGVGTVPWIYLSKEPLSDAQKNGAGRLRQNSVFFVMADNAENRAFLARVLPSEQKTMLAACFTEERQS